MLLSLYYTLVFPHLYYCNIAWGQASSSIIEKLKLMQKGAVRIITNSKYRTPSSPLFKKVNILKLTDILHFSSAAVCLSVQK